MERNRLTMLVAALVFVSVIGVSAQAETITQYAVDWRVEAALDYKAGSKGANDFTAVAADADGKLYVANYSNVLIVDADTGETIGTVVDKSGTIQLYSDVAVDADGELWIADTRSRVYRVDSDGNILTTVAFKTSPGFNDERIPGPLGFGPDGNLYVSYGGLGMHFQVFTPEGEYVRSIITANATLQGVGDFAFAPDGTLYFMGVGIGWISEEDGKVAAHVLESEFLAEQQFIEYRGLAIDSEGNFYFSARKDPALGLSVFVLDKDGNLIGEYGRGQAGSNFAKVFGNGEMAFQVSLALTADGDLIIADRNNLYGQLMRLTRLG